MRTPLQITDWKMKKLKLYLVISSLFLFAESLLSQNAKFSVVDTIYIDSALQSEKGNLELLTQRIHSAFAAYVDGGTIVCQKHEVNSKSREKQKQNTSRLIGSFVDHERFRRPVVFKCDSTQTRIPISREELRPITFDMVESIKVIYDPKRLPALYGIRGLYDVIEIKFIDDSKKK